MLGPPVQAQDNPSTQELADLRDRAEAGDADAQFTLGEFYTAGEGVLQDDVEARRWYNLADAWSAESTDDLRAQIVLAHRAIAERMMPKRSPGSASPLRRATTKRRKTLWV